MSQLSKLGLSWCCLQLMKRRCRHLPTSNAHSVTVLPSGFLILSFAARRVVVSVLLYVTTTVAAAAAKPKNSSSFQTAQIIQVCSHHNKGHGPREPLAAQSAWSGFSGLEEGGGFSLGPFRPGVPPLPLPPTTTSLLLHPPPVTPHKAVGALQRNKSAISLN